VDILVPTAQGTIKYLAQRTFNRNSSRRIGGFGALLPAGYASAGRTPSWSARPTDVGTKLKDLRFELGMHHTVGAGPGEPPA